MHSRVLTAAFAAIALLSSTSCTRVEPGMVGIVVNLAGKDRGVSDYPVQTGWLFFNPFSQSVFEWPTFIQTAKWTASKEEGSPIDESVSFNDRDGVVISADVSLSYRLQRESVPRFYVKFRTSDMEAFTHGYLRNVARDAFNEVCGHYSVEDVYGPKKEEILKGVRGRINKQVEGEGLVIEQFGFIGAPRPPQNVVASINAKIQAVQDAIKAENELRTREAEAKKKVADSQGTAEAAITEARGQAEANRLLTESVTPALIRWRELQIQQDQVARWNGQLPQFLAGEHGMPALLMQAPTPTKR